MSVSKTDSKAQATLAHSAISDNFSVKLICRNCRNPVPNIVEDFSAGDYVCGDCGLVLGDRIIDTRSEWRTFADSEGDDPSRVGDAGNPFLDEDQLDTIITRTGDNGSNLSRTLNRVQGQSKSQQREHILLEAYKTISTLCDSYAIPKTIKDIAKQLFKKVADERLCKGRNNDATVAVCIFLACRQGHAPRTFKEICALTRVSLKEVTRTLKVIKGKLDTETGMTSSNDLIERFCSNLKLDYETRRIARILSENARNLGDTTGKSPLSVAGACIYMATQLIGRERSPKDISTISGISELTIKCIYKILYNSRKALLTPDILKHGHGISEANLNISQT
ncbi:transcription initiation factor IIB [Coemansia reversa NRRL 1564]|uniref:Transcription initiation factor IIB n=1 Tax=Coemansia reversa (strain ATCC 12441 / NRRL 1564) TaxID=763665 RepID=A0A2G5BDY1_COERN|nr:transcription initiation factor IIB [Coemansia reversa NRRL 1564]|eukprot:PIA17226.1 transcription initiation factor IIB [Coemansia reversa NRRL 1564]